MNFFLFHSPANNPDDKPVVRELLTAHESPHTTNENDWFSGNAVRIKEQPLMFTEDCIAAGCPDHLW